MEDTEATSNDKADEISFQTIKNVNTAVKTNSAFQSTTTSSEDCITISSPSNPSPDVLPTTTSTEISILSASDVSNRLFTPKPDVVILQTDYVTDKPGSSNIGTPDSVSVPSPDTVNIVLNESTINPVEKPEAIDKWAVTPRQQRKRKAPEDAKQIRDKKSPVHEDKFLLLSDAFQECDGISDDETDVALLPPENVDGDTDNECGNDTELTDISLGLVKEVFGTIEINTSRKVTKTKRKNVKYVKKYKLSAGYRKKVEEETERVKTMQDEEENFHLKIDSLVSSAETLDGLRNWKATTDNNENKGLQWKTEVSDTNRQNFKKLYHARNGKISVKTFEVFQP